MAVNDTGTSSAGRRVLLGGNVLLSIVLVGGIVAVAQALAYRASAARWDMTSSGVNSLSDGTVSLLRGLDKNIRLTSLYFETDREEADQSRYRHAARNLLDLYEASNRGKISTEWINPLKDQDKLRKLGDRLRSKSAYKDAITTYQTRVDEFKNRLDGLMRQLVQAESEMVKALQAPMGVAPNERAAAAVAPIETLFMQLSTKLEMTREQVDALTMEADPQLSAAIAELQTLYATMSKALKDVAKFANEQLARGAQLPAAQAEYLRGAGDRFADVLAAVEAETTQLQELQPLKVDDVLRELQPTSNAILVETDEEARVVDFATVWPPVDQGAGARARFDQRAFKGEEKLTSAILRVTHKEQTAVVFVRYGGMPLFLGGFMPGQPPAPYGTMKQQLEDANFIVHEWDLKSSETPPAIDPAPTRTIFVVMKPTPPERGPMGQMSQEPPFSDAQRQALLTAMGDNGRALFIAGWAPGPFGPIPGTYEYGEYLKNNWGITVDTSALLIDFVSTAPGQYNVVRRDFFFMDGLEVTDHDIVTGAQARRLSLPWCAPLELASPAPEGVTLSPLVIQPKRDGLWGVKNIQRYEDQQRERGYLTREPEDLEGPYTLAVAARRADAKIVVISARDFAEDQVAFAREVAMGPQGFVIRSRNPGNVTLLINSLHWLNDNTQFMNIGKPIDSAVLQIASKSTEKFVQLLTIFVWPALALCCGGAVWWVRRK